jgi:hypothetical protein
MILLSQARRNPAPRNIASNAASLTPWREPVKLLLYLVPFYIILQ